MRGEHIESSAVPSSALLLDALAQLTSALSDRYAVEREIGAGGMATVYLARDLRHDRRVALKVLNPELGAVLGVERFLSEIRVTANLQHPNLLPLFDSGEVGGTLFYVMPYVEGESLRHRLAREQQLPVDDAVRIAIAVANALDYAHSHGVIHRDLKPENILLQHGQPVVADFGIALAISNAGGGRITQTGLSLGTPQYMSPEQATGDRVIDGRTDVYSLAAVLYEMLAGEPPHAGPTAQAIIAKLMTEDVRPLSVLRKSVPPYLDAAVRRALEKLPADRFATAAQFAEAIGTPREIGPGVTEARPSAATARSRLVGRVAPWIVAAVGIAFGLRAMTKAPVEESRPSVHFTLPIKAPLTFDPSRQGVAVTPTGSHIVFTGSRNGATAIFVRSVTDPEPREIPGTVAAGNLFFSPDGAWIGFRQAADARLQRVAIGGGPVTTIATRAGFTSPAWSSKDVIVFTRGVGSPLFVVPAAGGAEKQLTSLDTAHGELTQASPAFTPDGRAIVFTSFHSLSADRRLAVATLDGRIAPLDLIGDTPTFVAPDILVYATMEGVLQAVRFDPKRYRAIGKPVALLDGVAMRGAPPQAAFGVSSNGSLLAYIHGLPLSRLALVGASGETQVLRGDAHRYRHPRVSPKGDRVAVDILAADGTQDVWIYDINAGALAKLTLDGRSSDPVWSPDGKRIAFSRVDSAAGTPDVYSILADGSDQPKLMIGGAGSQYAAGWLPDGKSFLYDEMRSGDFMHIAVRGDTGAGRTIAGSQSGAVRLPAASPDGRWIAYTSNESRRTEVFVRPLEGSGRWQVSTEGGTQPVWSRDSKTLFYREAGHIVAATVSGGASFGITSRHIFVDDHFALENTINYDAMPDGKRLVTILPVDDGTPQISVIVNWIDEIRKRLGK